MFISFLFTRMKSHVDINFFVHETITLRWWSYFVGRKIDDLAGQNLGGYCFDKRKCWLIDVILCSLCWTFYF